MVEYSSGESLRILLISAEEEARDEVDRALVGWRGQQRLFWVSQPDLAVSRAQDLLPHVVLVDNELAGAHPIALIRELTRRLPGAAIVALVSGEAMGLAREAVLAGARGFVVKPLQADELVITLREVVRQRGPAAPEPRVEERRPGRIVVFCAPRGGTGRTTLAINTALSLRLATNEGVALVDADFSAPAVDVALNLPSERNVADLLPRLSRLDEDLISGVLVVHASGLHVLLAPPPADLSAPISLPQVQHILVLLKRMYPWVVVDLGLPLDETAFAFLDSADRIVISVLPEMVGLRNTRLMLDQLHDRGYTEDSVCLVLNRASMPGGIGQGDIEERLRVRVRHHIPDDQAAATHSINRGVPLVLNHQRSAVARAIGKLAQQLMEGLPAEDRPRARGRLIDRWLPSTGSATTA
jgi:pilus assembly protein CpaE